MTESRWLSLPEKPSLSRSPPLGDSVGWVSKVKGDMRQYSRPRSLQLRLSEL
jgi:hypothetical protein